MKTLTFNNRTLIIFINLVIVMLLCLSSCARTIKYPLKSEWEHQGITSLESVRANGLKHAVLIRGTNRSNPILLFIHPMGIPSMCFSHLEYPQSSESQIEKKFTVIHYDQRGFGKTYLHGQHSRKKTKLENYVCDAESLVVSIRKRFNNRKIIVLGESWGSLIGVSLVARHPDWFYAYVGVGQNVKGSDMLTSAYNFCLNAAEQENNPTALMELRKISVPIPDMSNRTIYKSMQITGRWIDYYLAKKYQYNSDAGIFFKSLWEAPEYSFIDFQSTLTGYISTGKKVIRDACFYDLKQNITNLTIPVYMIMGEYDFWTPIAKSYFDTLHAPSKEWHVINGAGHMVRGDKPEEVEKILLNRVLATTVKD